MEYLILLGLLVAIIFVVIWKTREGNPSPEDEALTREIHEARANAPINNVTGKEQSVVDKIPADVIAKAPPFKEGSTKANVKAPTASERPLKPPPPPPPAMRTGAGTRGPTPPTRPTPPPVRVFRNEKHVRDEPVTTQNNGLSLTDVVVGALVLDALTPDPVETPKSEPTIEPGGGSFGGGGSSASWDDTPSSSPSRDSDYSSPSYDSPSSSSSDSSSSYDSSSSDSSSSYSGD